LEGGSGKTLIYVQGRAPPIKPVKKKEGEREERLLPPKGRKREEREGSTKTGGRAPSVKPGREKAFHKRGGKRASGHRRQKNGNRRASQDLGEGMRAGYPNLNSRKRRERAPRHTNRRQLGKKAEEVFGRKKIKSVPSKIR